jgi:hypothetical protein
MIKLSRTEMARLNSIRVWLDEQRRTQVQMTSDPLAAAILSKLPEDVRMGVEEMHLTPLVHVRWLLAILDREGTGTK